MLDKPNSILIMCGGRGSRMGDMTSQLPKPLIEINGKTVLEHKLNNYIRQGFEDFVIAVGYKKNRIKDLIYSLDDDIKSKVSFSYAGKDVGILERLYFASKKINSPLIVTYGDTIANVKLNELLEFHNVSKNKATIVVTSIINPFGLVKFNSNNKVKVFEEKPALNYFIGYFMINPDYIRNLNIDIICMQDAKGLLSMFSDLISKEELGSYFYNGKNITFNTPYELEVAKQDIINFYTSKEEECE